MSFESWNPNSLRDVPRAIIQGKLSDISDKTRNALTLIQEHKLGPGGAAELEKALPMRKVQEVPALDMDNQHARAGLLFVYPTFLGIEPVHDVVQVIPGTVAFQTYLWAGELVRVWNMCLPPGNQWSIIKAWQEWVTDNRDYACFEEGTQVLMGDANANPRTHPALNAHLLDLAASMGMREITPDAAQPTFTTHKGASRLDRAFASMSTGVQWSAEVQDSGKIGHRWLRLKRTAVQKGHRNKKYEAIPPWAHHLLPEWSRELARQADRIVSRDRERGATHAASLHTLTALMDMWWRALPKADRAEAQSWRKQLLKMAREGGVKDLITAGWAITALQCILRKARTALGLQVEVQPSTQEDIQEDAAWLQARLQCSKHLPGTGGTTDDRRGAQGQGEMESHAQSGWEGLPVIGWSGNRWHTSDGPGGTRGGVPQI